MSDLTVSVLPNEISGSFTDIPFSTTDPYQLPASTTLKMRRYDWMGVTTPLPNGIKHIQVKVTFPDSGDADELYALGITPHV